MIWAGELLKIIVYPASIIHDAAEMYQIITGASPDIFARAKLPPPILSQASGEWEGFTLAVSIRQGRVETLLTNVDPEPTQPTPVPLMPPEQLDDALQKARAIAVTMNTLAATHRVAGHAQLVQDTVSAEAGAQVVNSIVGDAFPPDARDLLFQMNVRREMKGGGTMNRIVKVGQVSLVSVQVNLDPAARHLAPSRGDERHVAYLHLDINSKHEDMPVSSSRADEMSADVWDEVQRIRTGGFDALR